MKDKSNQGKVLEWIKTLTELIRAISYPIFIIIALFLFYKPLKQISEILPTKFEQANKISINKIISLEIEKKAQSKSYPGLAEKIGDLSPKAIDLLMLTEDHHCLVIRNEYNKTFRLPDKEKLEALKELEEKSLIKFRIGLDDFLEYLLTLSLIQHPELSTNSNSYEHKNIKKKDLDTILDEDYYLTESGKAGRDAIREAIIELISLKEE